MTDQEWDQLIRVINGERLERPPVALLADGPWFSAWAGMSLLDYYSDDRLWLKANLEGEARFPDVTFMVGFWSEYGMISNPPSFGTKCIWPAEGFPTCEPVIRDASEVDRLEAPNPRTDGLTPFLLKRLELNQKAIEDAGHRIRFATAHGPITIASYILGHTETLLAMRIEPDAIHRLLTLCTDYAVDWIQAQKELFPSIDGILVLEDLMGFLGEVDFQKFALPYLTKIFQSFDATVRFLHNDAYGLLTAPHLEEMGVNLFNFSFEHDAAEIRRLAGDTVTLMGNIPPRDVLAMGTCDDVRRCVRELLQTLPTTDRLLVSAGGFVPGAVTTQKIETLCSAVADW
jgi:uroporphyrinogen-III decarboxylase